MIEPILKEITKEEYNPNNDDHIKKGCYNEGHGILYQMSNPPDYYKYYKIIGKRYVYVVGSGFFDKLQELNMINKKGELKWLK